jgi:hypothetical protein
MNLVDLRSALAKLERVSSSVAPQQPVATGWDAVDALCGGGLAGGKVAEVIGPRSSGKMSFAFAAVARATAAGHLVAWIDAAHELHPPSAVALGVELDRLLVVRPPATAIAAARATEIVARSNAFALIVIDLPHGARLTEHAGSRLRVAVHESGVGVVALAGAPAVPHPALRLEVSATHQPGRRRVAITLARGGAQPMGARAELILGGEPLPADAFRSPAQTAALLDVAPIALHRRRS